jgi:hypothetical protein
MFSVVSFDAQHHITCGAQSAPATPAGVAAWAQLVAAEVGERARVRPRLFSQISDLRSHKSLDTSGYPP